VLHPFLCPSRTRTDPCSSRTKKKRSSGKKTGRKERDEEPKKLHLGYNIQAKIINLSI